MPPGKRPVTSVAVGKRRERPRPGRANLAPRPSTGSLTPHVLVSMSKTGAARTETRIQRRVMTPCKRGSPDVSHRSALHGAGVLVRVNTALAALAADAVLTRPARAREQAVIGAVGRGVGIR